MTSSKRSTRIKFDVSKSVIKKEKVLRHQKIKRSKKSTMQMFKKGMAACIVLSSHLPQTPPFLLPASESHEY